MLAAGTITYLVIAALVAADMSRDQRGSEVCRKMAWPTGRVLGGKSNTRLETPIIRFMMVGPFRAASATGVIAIHQGPKRSKGIGNEGRAHANRSRDG